MQRTGPTAHGNQMLELPIKNLEPRGIRGLLGAAPSREAFLERRFPDDSSDGRVATSGEARSVNPGACGWHPRERGQHCCRGG